MEPHADPVAPVPIELPRVGHAQRARRLARTMALASRRLAPLAGSVLDGDGRERRFAASCRALFEDLGTTYVKFGQFIASAPAVVGEAMAAEFRACLDSGPAVPFAAVRAAVVEAAGGDIGRAYAQIEERPIAAASVAVVHRARLHDGREVAVKVLRPGVERLVAADLSTMEPLARFIASCGFDQGFNIVGLVVGLRAQIAEELDLRNEARTMDRFRALFAALGLDRLVVPHVHHELTSRRVLVMDYVDGVAIDDLSRIDRIGVDPRPLVRDLLRAWVLSALRTGAFHADIHAGNMLVLPDGRLAVLDWGILARLDDATRALVRRLCEVSIGIESAWDELIATYIAVSGHGLAALGLSEEQIARFIRGALEPVLTQPMGEVSMASLLASGDDVVRLATGEAPRRRTLIEKARAMRAAGRAYREDARAGAFEAPVMRASFLASKQLVYLERYGRMYLPHETLLGDEDFLRRALAEPDGPSPDMHEANTQAAGG